MTGAISMKLGTNVHHVSGHYWRDFQGHGFKGQGHIMCTSVWMVKHWRRTFQWYGV